VLVTSNLDFASCTRIFGDPRLTPAEGLLQVFVRRYGEGAIILTTNRSVEDCGKVLVRLLPLAPSWTGFCRCCGRAPMGKKLPNAAPQGTAKPNQETSFTKPNNKLGA